MRAAAALTGCAARRWHRARPAVRQLEVILLGADPAVDRAAAIAVVLAGWLAEQLHEAGADPRDFARAVIAASVADEAAECHDPEPPGRTDR
jgi:hypothetical protein